MECRKRHSERTAEPDDLLADAFEMLFNSGGLDYITQFDTEKRLSAGGFNIVAVKGGGFCDEDFAPYQKHYELERWNKMALKIGDVEAHPITATCSNLQL